MMNITYIVGDRFENFAKNPGIITISAFEEMTRLSRIGKARNGIYILGQGVSQERITRIKQLLKDNKINDMILKDDSFIKESSNYVHKYATENVIISKPLAINKNFFVGKLMIDDRCAEMLDHTTGHHVQGMVLVEAARQMILSVSENCFFSLEERFNSYFVLQNIDVQFKQFIFPLEVEIHCTVIEYQKDSTGKFTAKCCVEFMQNNMSCMQVTISFSADEKFKLQRKEEKFANLAVQLACSKEQENFNKLPVSAECAGIK